MIKFFRKIRQNVLSEGKTGKYFKYAIGEIVLVVIGILIALQINNASQQNTNRKQVETILKSIFYDLESDMASPINSYLGFCQFKDSLNTLVLSKTLTFKDYELAGKGFRGLSRLLNYEFEPFQFKDQAYERMMANIEIIPEEYMTIVEMLQDVYGKEVVVVNEVAVDLKNFIDEIDDKYQNNYKWYSDTDSLHFKQRINYLLYDPNHLNDVRRHQELVNHLESHMQALKMKVSIAYSKIHQVLLPNEPFSEIVNRSYFPSEEELAEFEGLYKATDEIGNSLKLVSKEYYLTDINGNVKLIKSSSDKFVPVSRPETHYMKFERDAQGNVNAMTIFMTNNIGEQRTITYNKVD
jgi:hypothetical protein